MKSTNISAPYPHFQSPHFHQRHNSTFPSSMAFSNTQNPHHGHRHAPGSLNPEVSASFGPQTLPNHSYGRLPSLAMTTATATTMTKISTPLSSNSSLNFEEDDIDEDVVDVENHHHHHLLATQRRYRPGASPGGDNTDGAIDATALLTPPSTGNIGGGGDSGGNPFYDSNDATTFAQNCDPIKDSYNQSSTSSMTTTNPMMLQTTTTSNFLTHHQKIASNDNEIMAQQQSRNSSFNDLMLHQKTSSAKELMFKAAMGAWDMRRHDVGLVMVRLLSFCIYLH